MGDERFDLEDPATAVADNWDVLPKVLENQDSEEDSEDEHQAGARGTGVSAEPGEESCFSLPG